MKENVNLLGVTYADVNTFGEDFWDNVIFLLKITLYNFKFFPKSS